MSYKKLIIYGKRLELYEYEREPSLFRSKRANTSKYVSTHLRDDRSSLLGLSQTWNDTKKTKRQDNTRRAQMAFRRLVLCNLSGRENPLLLTFTYRQNQREVSEGFRDFTTCIQSIRYKCGEVFRYICVPEFQKRGAVHFHALFWSVRKELLGIPRQWPENSIDCFFWDKGFVFLKETDGHEKIANYLSKYMAKAFADPRLANKKAYVASRNITRPKFFGGLSDLSLDYVMSDYTVDKLPLIKRTYMTQYLGSCDYQRFIIM